MRERCAGDLGSKERSSGAGSGGCSGESEAGCSERRAAGRGELPAQPPGAEC